VKTALGLINRSLTYLLNLGYSLSILDKTFIMGAIIKPYHKIVVVFSLKVAHDMTNNLKL